jgi:hypothetical protein
VCCKAKIIIEVAEKVAQETSAYWFAMAFGVLVLVVCILIHFYRKGQNTLPVRYVKLGQNKDCVGFNVANAKLQFPATVAIEYRLLPGQSI